MELVNNVGLHNRFDLELKDSRTGEIKQKAYAENIILNNLWINLCSYDKLFFSHIYYGSGSGEPTSSRNSLFQQIGVVAAGSPTYHTYNEQRYATCVRSITLDENTSKNTWIREVGVGTGSNTGLCTHAMLKDMEGNPISLYKTDVDILTITATLYIHWSGSCTFTPYFDYNSNSGSYSYAGMRGAFFGVEKNTAYWPSYQCRTWPASILLSKENPASSTHDDYWGWDTGNGIWITNSEKGWGSLSFDPGNKRITFTGNRIPVGSGNIAGGIGTICFVCYARKPALAVSVRQFYEGTVINDPPESVGTGDGTTTKYKLKFDCPEDVTVFINGNETEDVIIKSVPRGDYNLGFYIKELYNCSTTKSWQERMDHFVTNNSTSYSLGSNRLIFNGAAGVGFKSVVNNGNNQIVASDDLINWDVIAEASAGTVTIPEEKQHYKYWKNLSDSAATLNWNSNDGCAITFTTPPPNGATITATYRTPYIAKDDMKVLDINYVLQFGEWQE